MAGNLAILNPRPSKLPGPQLLHDLISASHDRDAVAIEHLSPQGEIESLTYHDLIKRSDALARRLVSIRDKSESSNSFIVPLYIQQCPNLYIAQLAILKAGGAFCPIPLDAPEERLRFILKDVDAEVLLTSSELNNKLPTLDDVSILSVENALAENVEGSLSTEIDSSQPAYVMYTSGSTGLPKGVLLSHSAATQALLAHDPHIPQFSRFLQFANPTFDVSVFEIFFPFFRGSTLVCCDRRQLLSDLPGCINKLQIDAAELTPSVASSLLRGRQSVPSLKLLLTIGEMLKRDVVEEFGGSADHQSVLYGMYGPTEATIHCTLQTQFSNDMPVNNIGVPLKTVSAFVIKTQDPEVKGDQGVEILSIDEEGELAVGGYQLAQGYLNRDEQTKAAFVEHPEYGRLYRTGDRARLLSNGKLECLGRISSGQVKLRGQRIELGEIEHAASKTDGCRTVIAEVINGTLVAFCICDDSSVSQQQIRDVCRQWLPAFMVPGDMMLLEGLPYLPSGKVDRKALQAQYAERQEKSQSHISEISPRLRTIIECTSEILGTEINPDTQLPSVGLDSLSSIRLSSAFEKRDLPKPDAAVLLEARTVRDIERSLEESQQTESRSCQKFEELCAQLRHEANSNDLTKSLADQIDDVFPATAMQSAMLVETSRDSRAYCNWVQLRVQGEKSPDEISSAIHKLAAKHIMLRAGFLALGDSMASHAVIAWKALSQEQVQDVGALERDFQIENDTKLLRPCSFQVLSKDGGVEILLQIHHALYDQWSIDILRSDLKTLLHKGDGETKNVPTFREVSSFQFLRAEEASSDASFDFWQNHLRDFVPSGLPLMVGQKLPREQQRCQWRYLDVDLSSLRERSKETGHSAPSFFQAALSWLLSCYIGESDITYGVVFSGRHLPLSGMDGIFGPCLATLPLRVDSSSARTCADLVRVAHDQNRSLQRHHLTPLHEIRKAAECPAGTALFDTLLVWQESTLHDQEVEDMVRETNSADRHEFRLVLEFEPLDDHVRARGTFQQNWISEEQVELLLQQVCVVVEHLVSQPESLVTELADCCSQDSLLSISNPSPSRAADGRTLIEAIEQHAHASSAAPAVVFAKDITDDRADCEVLTYGEFNERANRLARYLHSLKLRPEEVICVCMEKSLDLYVAALAVVKVGGNYLPLLPDTPVPRLKSILSQANARICLCDDMSIDVFRDIEGTKPTHIPSLSLEAFDRANLGLKRSGSDTLYTIFTSGSTGEPKGVAVTTDNLLGNLKVLEELYKVQQGDRLLQACSQAFDVSVFEIFFTFYAGISLCTAAKDVLYQDIEASIRALEITHLSLTPTVAALIDPPNVPSVRFLVTAGEGVTDLVHQRWAGNGLNQGYGPSETTNICTINMNMAADDVLGNIGPPFRNTSAFVMSLGPDSKILPAGSRGEFVFGGEQVFRGYLGRDDLNSEKIIEDPRFGRLYKSGDIGRILPDGSLLIGGRVDDQVKVRGNRVELGEVNAVILHDNAVLDCTTLLVDDGTLGESLISFAVISKADNSGAQDASIAKVDPEISPRLAQVLESTLPSYMVPNFVVPVTKLPLTSSGKLDKRSLRKLFSELNSEQREQFSRSGNVSEDNEDWTDQERDLAATLASVLSIPETAISRSGSFFSYGLNSLNAIAFARKSMDRLGTPVTVSNVLQSSNIARLARSLAKSGSAGPSNNAATLHDIFSQDCISKLKIEIGEDTNNIERILPCTPLQEAMLSASTSKSGSAYCNTIIFDLVVDSAKLKKSWDLMASRHQILRTRFVRTSSRTHPFAQVVLKKRELPWKVHTVDQDQIPKSASDLSETARAVDMILPLRFEAYLSNKDTKLALHMHHAIYDGISTDLLFREVQTAFFDQELPAPIPFEPFLAQMESQKSSDADAFWSSHLQNYTSKPFPKSKDIFEAQELSLKSRLLLDAGELDSFCKRHALSQLAVFQAALLKVLSCCQETDDVCLGNVMSGRSVPVQGVDRLVAPCFNTIPVRVELGRVRNNLDLVQRVQKDNISMLQYQLTPMRRIQTLRKSPSGHLFDCLFILQPAAEPLNRDIWTIDSEHGDMDIPLVFEIMPSDNQLALTVHYMHPIIYDDLANDLSTAFASAISSILKFPSSDVTTLAEFDANLIAGKLKAETTYIKHTESDDSTEDEVWSEAEEQIRQVFSELASVNVDSIKKNTSMYQIGLDSLNAAQVATRLRSYGMKLDAADVMENLTPSLIASVAGSGASTPQKEPDNIDLDAFDGKYRQEILQVLRLQSDSLEAVRPCTPVQCGMIAQSLSSVGKLYVNHVTYCLPTTASLDSITTAWQTVQRKHQVLRLGFQKIDNNKSPFVMTIRKFDTAGNAVTTEESDNSIDNIESNAQRSIIQRLDTLPWHVSLQKMPHGIGMTLSIHHALYDAESLALILGDVAKALHSSEVGSSTSIDALLKATLSAAMDTDGSTEKFWRNKMEGASVSKFPDLTPSRGVQSSLKTTSMPCSSTIRSVEKFCRDNGATVQALGQTIWALLLSAYLGDPNVTFGTILSGKPTSNSWDIAFPSITTVPVPCNGQQNPATVLKSMVEFNASSQRHRFASLADIQRFAGDASASLFDTVFVYQKALSQRDTTSDWELVKDTSAVDYAVSLELESGAGDELLLRLTYNTGRVPDEHAQVLLNQYDYLVSAIVSGSDALSGLNESIFSICHAKEPELSTSVEYLHQFVEKNARDHPDRVALEFVYTLEGANSHKQTWTYKELDERANQIANLIRTRGIGAGNVVAISMDKCPQASFAFVGILKSGCSFLAMDPALPDSRVEFILKDSNAKLFLTDEDHFDQFSKFSSISPVTDLPAHELKKCPTDALDHGMPDPDATCYCLYTSGTTGTPKGCELTHRNAVQAMMAFQRLFSGHWTNESRWLQFASYWFDVSVLEQFWSWSAGIAVVGAPRDVVLDDLPGFISQMKITHIDLTPSLARLLDPEDVPSLWDGVFITGGEALKQEIIDAWGPKGTICNGYGPTEATIGVTMNPFIREDANPSNIGPPFDNVGAYVLRPDSDEPVLRGAVGELCVFGHLVGKGYLNRQDLTEKSFPFLDRLGERVYRTGDLVRLLADGSVSFIGRKDTQAKLRGQRLEIGEIDSVIQQAHESIAEVVSLVHKSEDGKEMLISFIATGAQVKGRTLELDLSKSGTQLASTANEACADRLPGYMVPTHFIPVTFLPLTVNNKVDTKRLTALFNDTSREDLQRIAGPDQETQALSGMEQQVASALAEMLEIDSAKISKSSNLFSLGLSSISAISLSSLLKRRGFKDANVATIMSNQTIGKVTAALSGSGRREENNQPLIQQTKLSLRAFSRRHRRSVARSLSVDTGDIESVVPCLPLQHGMLIDSMNGTNGAYFNDFKYVLHDADTKALKRAFQSVVSNVETLRARFVETDEGYVQVILRRSQVPFSNHSIEARDELRVLKEFKEAWIARNEVGLVVPFEVHVVHSPSSKTLLIHAHHAIYDGISFDLMMEKLFEAYRAETPVHYGPSFTDALPYGPLWQRKDAKKIWSERMSGHTYTALPAKNERADRPARLATRIDDTADLEAVRKRLGVSHQAVMQACFEAALYNQAPTARTYGLVVSGRSIEFEDADRIIGPLFNTLPYPLGIAPQTTWSRQVQDCHESNTALLPYQHTALRDIRKWCGTNPSDPMFDVLFVFQVNGSPDTIKGQTNPPWEIIDHLGHAEYPLACEVVLEVGGHMTVTLVGQQEYMGQTDLCNVLDDIKRALHVLVTDGDSAISSEFTSIQGSAVNDRQTPKSEPQVNGVHHFEWNEQSYQLREIIAQAAQVDTEEVDEHSSIFSLGLDSIDAVKLVSRCKFAGISISVSKALQAQTIPRMLEMSEDLPNSAHAGKPEIGLKSIEPQLKALDKTVPRLEANAIERILPATPNQEGLFADMLRSNLHEYFNHDVLRVSSNIDLDRLKNAWQTVVDASPILRTSFIEVSNPDLNATFAQAVHKPGPIKIGQYHFNSLDDIDHLLDTVRKEVLETWSTLPVLRLNLVTAESTSYLVLSLSHAQYDGHSLALLHEDVLGAYYGTFEPRPSYDAVINDALVATSKESRAFWSDMLAGAAINAFPRRNFDEGKSTTHRTEFKSSISAEKARSFCQKHGLSMQSLAQTSWSLVLANHLQSLEAVFGAVLACRDSEEAEQVLFPTMNTVVVRASLHGSRIEMLRHVQSTMTNILPYQRTPLRVIQSACADVVDRSQSSLSDGLFDCLFIYQHRPPAQVNQQEPLYESIYGSSNVEYPVAVEMEAADDSIVLRAACKDTVLDQQGSENLLTQLNQVMSAIIESPNEATIEFKDNDAVSICGLPSFELQDVELQGENEGHGEDDENAPAAVPDSPALQTIMEVLEQVSKMDQEEFSPTSSIESIGIDSISAIKVSSLLRKKGLQLSVSDLIQAKQASKMAAMISTGQDKSEENKVPSTQVISDYVVQNKLNDVPATHGIDPHNIEAILPASSGQQYMLRMWQKTGGQLFYPEFEYRLSADVSVTTLREAWTRLTAEHRQLRTIFCTTDHATDSVVQVILKSIEARFLEGNKVDDHIPKGQPMVSLRTIKNDKGLSLGLRIHHALYDAVSLPLIVNDLQALLSKSRPPKAQFSLEDYLALSCATEAMKQRKDFWTQYLANVQPIALQQPSTPGAQDKVDVFRPAIFGSCIRLSGLARRQNLSIQALLFATYAKLYSSLATSRSNFCNKQKDGQQKSRDVVFGIYLSNRSHLPDLDTLRAPTLNLVPLLVRQPAHKSLVEIAHQIQKDLAQIGSAVNSGVSLAEVAEWTGVEVDSFVNLLRLPDQDGEGDDQEKGTGTGRVNLEFVEEDILRERCRVVKADAKREFIVREELKGLKESQGYKHAVDIEMTVTEDRLDVGLFSPEAMLGLEDAEEALKQLKQMLDGLIVESKE